MVATAGTAIWFDNMLMKVLVDADSTAGAISVVEQVHYAGYGTPIHRHGREDQTLYVLSGAITARLGDDERRLSAGDAVFLPRGVPHAFRVEEDGTRLLEINTPGGFENFHADAGERATSDRLPDRSVSDVPRMVAVAERYDCQIIGPPMTA
jgi:quercetin dioxygenase-like cupin family protein